jgi:hypothetical protein
MSVRTKLRSLLEQNPSAGRETREGAGFLQSDFVRSMPFWVPPALLMGLFVYGGILWNFVLSLTDFSGVISPDYHPANWDFEMYAQMLSDPFFWNAVRNTAVLMIGFTIVCLAVGLVLAVLRRSENGLEIEQRRWIEDGRLEKEIRLKREEQSKTFLESVRLFDREDFARMYRSAGLELIETRGSYEGDPYEESSSPRLILFARKR